MRGSTRFALLLFLTMFSAAPTIGPSVPAAAQGLASTKCTAANDGRVFGLVVADGQTLRDALLATREKRMDLCKKIDAILQTGSPALDTVLESDVVTTGGAVPAALAGNPSFTGSLTLTGFDCQGSSCFPVGTSTLWTTFDLGYTTFRAITNTASSGGVLVVKGGEHSV